jgi:large subunit ribosomal protein L25
MASKHSIAAEPRKDEGKGASRRLRLAGKVPAILYGGKQAPLSIQFDHHVVSQYAKHEWFYSSIMDLDVAGTAQKVLLRDMQRHPFKPRITHLDLQRVSENEVIRIRIPLHFLNQEKSPAGKTSGVVITHELNDVVIACLPKDLPEYLEVDLSELAKGDTLHLSDLKLPAGVTIPELRLGKEHDVALVVAREMKEEVVEAAAPVGEGAAPSATGAAAAPAAGAAAPAAGGKAAPAAAKAAPAKDEKKK